MHFIYLFQSWSDLFVCLDLNYLTIEEENDTYTLPLGGTADQPLFSCHQPNLYTAKRSVRSFFAIALDHQVSLVDKYRQWKRIMSIR